MYIFLLIVHVIVCLVLILVVLLQAGRGGGFSEMIGGGQPQSIFGTETNAFMTKATEICAVLFVITSLSLGILSTQRGKSLIEREMRARAQKTSATTATIPAASSTAAAPTATSAPAAVPVAASAPTATPATGEPKPAVATSPQTPAEANAR